MDEQEEAYYTNVRSTYPPQHIVHSMSLAEFAEWYERAVFSEEAASIHSQPLLPWWDAMGMMEELS